MRSVQKAYRQNVIKYSCVNALATGDFTHIKSTPRLILANKFCSIYPTKIVYLVKIFTTVDFLFVGRTERSTDFVIAC